MKTDACWIVTRIVSMNVSHSGRLPGRRRAAGMAQQTADWMAAVALKEVQFAGETV